ncbi:MAG: hypothetical protein INR71_06535 [Terriglobus roseus]|nr:hypothetical protein [Terriglobus roseus]
MSESKEQRCGGCFGSAKVRQTDGSRTTVAEQIPATVDDGRSDWIWMMVSMMDAVVVIAAVVLRSLDRVGDGASGRGLPPIVDSALPQVAAQSISASTSGTA